MYQTSTLIFLT